MDYAYLKLTDLQENDENHFTPLSNGDFMCLVESIKECGILDPLIVAKNGSHYTILSGHNRFRAAKQLNLTEIPCRIIDSYDPEMLTLGAIFDTNLIRRELSASEKRHYRKLREKEAERILKSSLRGKLIPEIAKMLDNNEIDLTIARSISFLGEDKQKELLSVISEKFSVDLSAAELNKLKKEQSKAEEKIQELTKALNEREKDITKLKCELSEAKVRVVEKLEEFNKKKTSIPNEINEKYQKEIEDLRNDIKELSNGIKRKDREIDSLKEERQKIERILKVKEAEVNAAGMQLEFYKKTIRSIFSPDTVMLRFKQIREDIKSLIEIGRMQTVLDSKLIEAVSIEVRATIDALKGVEKVFQSKLK